MSARTDTGWGSLLRLYLDIALWRRGPEQVPNSVLVLPLTVALFLAVNSLLYLLGPDTRGNWLNYTLLDIGLLLAWYWLLLAVTGRRERFAQTSAAVFGYQTVLSIPVHLIVLVMAAAPQGGTLQAVLAPLVIAVLCWAVIANGYILRAALEWPLLACVLLAMAQFAGEELALNAMVR